MKRISTALALLGLTSAGALQAHDGGFVDTFGVQGREQIGFSPSLFLSLGFVSFVDVAVQGDGKLVVSATVANTSSSDIGVLRLNPNGTLDTNFGTQGQTIVGFDGGGSNNDTASSVMLQPNGRIVVCGQASGDPNAGGSDFGIVRLLANGTPDNQFSGDGKATVAFDLGSVGAREDYAVRCSLQSDGKIVAAGQAQADGGVTRMAVARLNTDGSRDTGFNGAGTATVDFGPSYPNDVAFSVKSLDNGDTLLIGGIASSAPAMAWGFARLDSGGQIDTGFGNGGIVIFDPGIPGYAAVEALDAVVLPDHSFIAIGAMLLSGGTNYDYGIFKLTPNGSLDTSWGNGGGQIVAFDLGNANTDLGVKIVEDAQGRFVVGGFSSAAVAPYTSSLLRLTPDGQLDPTFGVGGKLTIASAPPPGTDFGDQGTTVAVAPDGSIIMGSLAVTATSDYVVGLARLVGDTIFDNGFEND